MNLPQEAELKPRAFRMGIGLMAASFGVLPFYLAIPFLPVPSQAKVGIALVGWAISWGVFLIGSLFAGKTGYPYLKRLLREWFQKARPE